MATEGWRGGGMEGCNLESVFSKEIVKGVSHEVPQPTTKHEVIMSLD